MNSCHYHGYQRLTNYLSRPNSSHSLSFLRIAVALFALVQLWLVSDYTLPLYGNLGFMQWVISDAIKSVYLPSISQVSFFLEPYGFSGNTCVYAITAVYFFSLLGLLIGYFTRWMAFLAWFTHMIMMNSGFFSLYGVETMAQLALFHCVWMPVGTTFSIDALKQRRSRISYFLVNLSIFTLQIHLCLIYLNTGLAKASGIQWWNGKAIWRAVMQPQFTQYDFSWLAHVPWLAMGIGWLTLVIEIGYAFLI